MCCGKSGAARGCPCRWLALWLQGLCAESPCPEGVQAGADASNGTQSTHVTSQMVTKSAWSCCDRSGASGGDFRGWVAPWAQVLCAVEPPLDGVPAGAQQGLQDEDVQDRRPCTPHKGWHQQVSCCSSFCHSFITSIIHLSVSGFVCVFVHSFIHPSVLISVRLFA